MLKKIIIMILLCLASDVYSDWSDYEYNLLNPLVTFDYVGSSIPAYSVTSGTAVYSSDAGLLQGQAGAYWVSVATTATPSPDLSGYAIRADVITSTNSLQNQISAVQQSTYTVGSIQHELIQSTGTITHAQIETSLNNIGVSTGSIQSVISQIQIDTGTLSAVKLDTTMAGATYLTQSSATATYAYNDKDYAYLNSAQTFNSSVTINAALLVGTTLTVDVIKAWEIHVSTIVGRSPVKFDGAIKLSDDTLLTSTAAFAAAASYSLTTDTASYAWDSDKLDNHDSTVFLTTVTADSTYLTQSSATATYAYGDKDYAYLSSTQMFTGENYFQKGSTTTSLLVDKLSEATAESNIINSNDFKIRGSVITTVPTNRKVTPVMTNYNKPKPYTVTESSFYDVNTKGWAIFKAGGTVWWMKTNTGWLKVDYGEKNTVVISSYAFTSGNISSERKPKTWTLQGSDDDVTYTTLDTQSEQTGWAINEWRGFAFANTTPYRYIKMNITDNNGDVNYTGIADMEFYGEVGDTTIDKDFTFRVVPTSGGILMPEYKLSILNNGGSEALGLDGLSGALAVPGGFGQDASFIGRVQVGVTEPESYLMIRGTGTFGSTIMLYHENCSALGTNAKIGRIIANSTYGDENFTKSCQAAEITFLTGISAWYRGQIVFKTNGTDSTNANALERMRITEIGRVGINNSAPTCKLDVNGNANFTYEMKAGSATVIGESNVGGTLNVTGANGIINMYGMTTGSATITTYIQIPNDSSLPTSGIPESCLFFNRTDKKFYGSTEAVSGAHSWVPLH